MIWQEFEASAPGMARLGAERFERLRVALIGTIRKDGSPRISPVEPHIVHGDLLLGMLWRSKKALDLLRDPRCFLHSAISDINGSEGEFKLRGRAADVRDAGLRERYRQVFYEKWKSRTPEVFHIFSVDIESAAFVGWDIQKGDMIVKLWSPEQGLREAKRKYL